LKVVNSTAMDDERFQQMEKRLNEQVEATRGMNETLNKFIEPLWVTKRRQEMSPPLPQSPHHL
jgi:hypothetical protein